MQVSARGTIFYRKEIEDLILADLILTLAFTFVFTGGVGNIRGNLGTFITLLPISFVAVSVTFVLHELMHKFVAQRYGAIAAFQASTIGLFITLFGSMFLGFVIGLPGATVIYASNFTKEQNGYVSLAGPLTNLVAFFIALFFGVVLFHGFLGNFANILSGHIPSSYIELGLEAVAGISLIIGYFNMMPAYPLDGSKVLAWNQPVYILLCAIMFGSIAYLFGFIAALILTAYFLVFSLIVSFMSRGVMLAL